MIVSPTEVKEYLGLSSVNTTAASAIIDGLVGDLEAYLGRPATIGTFSEAPVLPSRWTGRIRLRRTPVRTVTSFTVDGTAVDSDYYALKSWGLADVALLGVPSTLVSQPVLAITYTAGLDGENESDPFGAAVKGKLLRKAAAIYQKVIGDGAAGADSVSSEGESVRYVAGDDTWTEAELKTLSRFKRRNSG